MFHSYPSFSSFTISLFHSHKLSHTSYLHPLFSISLYFLISYVFTCHSFDTSLSSHLTLSFLGEISSTHICSLLQIYSISLSLYHIFTFHCHTPHLLSPNFSLTLTLSLPSLIITSHTFFSFFFFFFISGKISSPHICFILQHERAPRILRKIFKK